MEEGRYSANNFTSPRESSGSQSYGPLVQTVSTLLKKLVKLRVDTKSDIKFYLRVDT